MLRPTRSGALLARLRGEYGGGESPVPSIVSITPNVGTEMGGTNVTIVLQGCDALDTNEVRFASSSTGVGGEPAFDLSPANSTTMTCTVPASPGPTGLVYVAVDVLGVGTLVGTFTYI